MSKLKYSVGSCVVSHNLRWCVAPLLVVVTCCDPRDFPETGGNSAENIVDKNRNFVLILFSRSKISIFLKNLVSGLKLRKMRNVFNAIKCYDRNNHFCRRNNMLTTIQFTIFIVVTHLTLFTKQFLIFDLFSVLTRNPFNHYRRFTGHLDFMVVLHVCNCFSKYHNKV